jgi:hypothetical protein
MLGEKGEAETALDSKRKSRDVCRTVSPLPLAYRRALMKMVERVARALSIADGMHPDACSNDADETPAWSLYLASARAAIEAMRIPNDAVEEAIWSVDCTGELPTESVDLVWAKAIDAALSE